MSREDSGPEAGPGPAPAVAVCRRYGRPPFAVAVVHGGPGAAGSMAPVARELAARHGVLEPLQGADSVEGQIEELGAVLREEAACPVRLIGHSWGAWLGLLVAARYPELVRQLVLVGCGPFTEAEAATIMPTRLARLTEAQRDRLEALNCRLATAQGAQRDALLGAFGALLRASDAYDPLPDDVVAGLGCQERIFRRVWPQAEALRREGRLLGAARAVRCPVLAIHGDFDPHPAAGVREQLLRTIRDFTWVLLPCCGHDPWRERQAREAFYRVVLDALGGDESG